MTKVGRTVPVSRLFSPFVVKKDKELYSPRRNEGPRRKNCHHSLQPLWSLCALWQIILFTPAAPDKKSTVLFRRGWLQPSSFAIPHRPFIRLRMSGDAHPYPQQTHDQGRANRPGEPPLSMPASPPSCSRVLRGKERQTALFTTKKRRSTKKELPSLTSYVLYVIFCG